MPRCLRRIGFMHLVALTTHWGPGGQNESKSCGRLLGSSNFWAGRAPALMTDKGHGKRCPRAFLVLCPTPLFMYHNFWLLHHSSRFALFGFFVQCHYSCIITFGSFIRHDSPLCGFFDAIIHVPVIIFTFSIPHGSRKAYIHP